jgi:hypothetical protein
VFGSPRPQNGSRTIRSTAEFTKESSFVVLKDRILRECWKSPILLQRRRLRAGVSVATNLVGITIDDALE